MQNSLLLQRQNLYILSQIFFFYLYSVINDHRCCLAMERSKSANDILASVYHQPLQPQQERSQSVNDVAIATIPAGFSGSLLLPVRSLLDVDNDGGWTQLVSAMDERWMGGGMLFKKSRQLFIELIKHKKIFS
jgi:hypothetical protein